MNQKYEKFVQEMFSHLWTSSSLEEKANYALSNKKDEINEIKTLLENKMNEGDMVAFAIYQVNFSEKINQVWEKSRILMKRIKEDEIPKEQIQNPLFDLRVHCVYKCLIEEEKAEDNIKREEITNELAKKKLNQ